MTDASFCIPRKAVDKLLKARADVRTIVAYLILARFTDKSGEFTAAAGHAVMEYAGIRKALHDKLFTRLLKLQLIRDKTVWQNTNPDRVWPDKIGPRPTTYALNTFGEPTAKRVWMGAGLVDGFGEMKWPLKVLKHDGKPPDDRAARLLLILYTQLRMAEYGGTHPAVISRLYRQTIEKRLAHQSLCLWGYEKQKAYVSPELQRIYPAAWGKTPTAKDQHKAAVTYAQAGGRPELGEGFGFYEPDWSTLEFATEAAAAYRHKNGDSIELGISSPVRRAVDAAMKRLIDTGLVQEVVTGFFGQEIEPRELPDDCRTVELEVVNLHGERHDEFARPYRQTAAELTPIDSEAYYLIDHRTRAVTVAGIFRPRFIPYNAKSKGVRDWQTRIADDNQRAMRELFVARKALSLLPIPLPSLSARAVVASRSTQSRPRSAPKQAPVIEEPQTPEQKENAKRAREYLQQLANKLRINK